jgi:SAM-dependent methyltransferase
LPNVNLNDVSYPLKCRQKWIQLHKWYQSHLGQAVFNSEKAIIQQQLDSCFGYTIVQLGDVLSENLIQCTRIKNKYVIQCSINENDIEETGVASLLQRLAIKSNSVDVVLLHHCLEFEAFPHEILREVERVLVAEGKLIIALFNPFSLMGLWYFLLKLKAKVTHKKVSLPVEQTWISPMRLDDWLVLLGFDSQKVGSVFFRPPINNLTILNKLNFMESTGKNFWPAFSGSVIYMATKRVSTLTPLRPKWRLKEKVVGSPIPESGVPEATNRKIYKNDNK